MAWSFRECANRSNEFEWIDYPNTSDQELASAYDFLKKTQGSTGGNSLVLNFLSSCSRRWSPGQPISILEFGCGRGDLSAEIANWAERRKLNVQILSVERYGRLVDLAREHHGKRKGLVFDCKEPTDNLFKQAQQFDYVISAFNLHRMPTNQVVSFLKTVELLSRRGFVLIDLLRDIRSFYLMKSLARVWPEEIIRHDAPLSVRRGFTEKEIRSFLVDAGIDYVRFKTHLGFRFSISGERRLLLEPKLAPLGSLAGA